MISNEDEGRIKSCNKFSNQPVEQILSEHIETGIVCEYKNQLNLNKKIGTMLIDLRAATKESNLHFKYKNWYK